MSLSQQDAVNIVEFVKKLQIKNVIFDLDGILLETDNKAIEKGMSVKEKMHMAKHVVRHRSKPTKQWLFDTLTKISKDKTQKFDLFDDHAAYNEDKKLPPIMSQWQAGIHTSNEARLITLECINEALSKDIITKNDAYVLKIITELTYDIDRFIHTQKITNGSRVVGALAYGNIKMAIVTNYAEDQFAACKKKFNTIFAHFTDESVVISAKEGQVKPNADLYLLALQRANMDPNFTLYIDDERVNIEGAFKCGIKYGYLPGHGLIINQSIITSSQKEHSQPNAHSNETKIKII